ncbi:MAG: hypothetical protein ACFFBD_26230 [Candidatus Hodarchaeota archaeon]
MHVKIQSEDSEVIAGRSTRASLVLSLQEEITELHYGGIELFTTRPCGRNFTIFSVSDIICQGKFEKGKYNRRRSISISPRVVPTIKERGIEYKLRADVSSRPVGKPAIEIFNEQDIIIKPIAPKPPKQRPASEVSLRGARIQLKNDQVRLGDELELSYQIDEGEFKEIGIRLMKEIHTSCSCPNYKNICSHIKPIPAEIIQTKTFNQPKEAKVKFTIPEDQEPSHSYSWNAHEEMEGLTAFSDEVSWFLSISGKDATGNLSLNFQIPIVVTSREMEAKEEDTFFAVQSEERIPSLKRKIKLVATEEREQSTIFHLKNGSDFDLEGVTVKAASIRNELFEWKPYMKGVKNWSKGTEIEIPYDKQDVKDITSFQITIEHNKGDAVKISVR